VSTYMNWSLLEHAYGKASDIPELISQLISFPDESNYENEPWFTLWSSLYHQGSIYSASFAAVPEIVKFISISPEKVTPSFFSLPSLIEIARDKENMEIDIELLPEYQKAIASLGEHAAKCISLNKSAEIANVATAAFAVSAGLHKCAELIIEVLPADLEETLNWYLER
jgi:hypothetical protein